MLKKLVISSLATLSVTPFLLTSLPASARTISVTKEQPSIHSAMVMPKSILNNRQENDALVAWEQNNTDQLGSTNLVESAYQGAFKDRVIPGYLTFLSEIREGELTAKDLVKSAIADHKLPPNAIDNSNRTAIPAFNFWLTNSR